MPQLSQLCLYMAVNADDEREVMARLTTMLRFLCSGGEKHACGSVW